MMLQGLKRSVELEKKKNVSVDAKANRLLEELSLTIEQQKLHMQQDFKYFLSVILQLAYVHKDTGIYLYYFL